MAFSPEERQYPEAFEVQNCPKSNLLGAKIRPKTKLWNVRSYKLEQSRNLGPGSMVALIFTKYMLPKVPGG